MYITKHQRFSNTGQLILINTFLRLFLQCTHLHNVNQSIRGIMYYLSSSSDILLAHVCRQARNSLLIMHQVNAPNLECGLLINFVSICFYVFLLMCVSIFFTQSLSLYYILLFSSSIPGAFASYNI